MKGIWNKQGALIALCMVVLAGFFPIHGLAEEAGETAPFDFTVTAEHTLEIDGRITIEPDPPETADGPKYTYSITEGSAYIYLDRNVVIARKTAGTSHIRVVGKRGEETAEHYVTINVVQPQDPFDFSIVNNNLSVEEGESQSLIVLPAASSINGIVYTYRTLDNNAYAKISDTGVVTGVKAGTTYIEITGTKGEEVVVKAATVKVTKKAAEKKLLISTSTNLDKKVGDANFILNVSFNVSKSSVDYSFESDNEDVATIDESTGLVRIRRAGTTVLTVNASADGYEGASKDFTLYVSPASTGSSYSGNSSSGSSSSSSSSTSTPGSTYLPGQTLTYNGKPLNLQFTGRVTVNGMDFRTSNNFSQGNVFALLPANPDGDWWRTPDCFTGSRGVYAAKNQGVATIIYADTAGKQYVLSINSYKTTEVSGFQVPQTIPVGALFALQPPVAGGRWYRNADM
ncbi:Ig-like domain-containing protein, partial [Ruminococcaceae bacterium OttesenSCG-928-L11]|nr:Ig-like domain-containing protein [Ruminococcaceae bacterium OttesenSCG-928-L11]